MFDSNLNQMLTTFIFAISSLISSYQIYNVKERIQEDNLRAMMMRPSLKIDLEGGKRSHLLNSRRLS